MYAPTVAFNKEAAVTNDLFNHDDYGYNEFINLHESGKDTITIGQTSEEISVYLSHNHTDEIKNVQFYVAESEGATKASILSTNAETYNITSGTNDLLVISLDDRGFDYSITLPSGSAVTASQVVDRINETIGEIVATTEDVSGSTYVRLTSPSRGSSSKIYIKTSSTAASVLGFPTDDTNPVAEGKEDNWGNIGNGAWGKSIGEQVTYPFTITSGSNDQIRTSVDFETFRDVTLVAGTVNDDSEFETMMTNSLTNAGYNVGTDIFVSVSDGVLTLRSGSTGPVSSVRVKPGSTNDGSATIGMSNPTETRSVYANSSATEDYNELLTWGDNSAGLEIGDNGSPTTWTRVDSSTGISTNPINLTWGDGSTPSDIARFDYTSPTPSGEVLVKFRLSIPSDEPDTGIREYGFVVRFDYV